jgi:hypothetical protein
MDRRLKESFEMHTVNPAGVCEKCKATYLGKGVLMINPKTGSLVVIADDAFKRITGREIPEGKIVFTEEAVVEKLMEADKKAKKKLEEEVL